jgi:hypothetical protein
MASQAANRSRASVGDSSSRALFIRTTDAVTVPSLSSTLSDLAAIRSWPPRPVG